MGNNHKLFAIGKGTVHIRTQAQGQERIGMLTEVYYVPGLKLSLASVSKMIRENHSVIFDKAGCRIKNQAGQEIMTASKQGNLFRLDAKTLGAGQGQFDENN